MNGREGGTRWEKRWKAHLLCLVLVVLYSAFCSCKGEKKEDTEDAGNAAGKVRVLTMQEKGAIRRVQKTNTKNGIPILTFFKHLMRESKRVGKATGKPWITKATWGAECQPMRCKVTLNFREGTKIHQAVWEVSGDVYPVNFWARGLMQRTKQRSYSPRIRKALEKYYRPRPRIPPRRRPRLRPAKRKKAKRRRRKRRRRKRRRRRRRKRRK